MKADLVEIVFLLAPRKQCETIVRLSPTNVFDFDFTELVALTFKYKIRGS